MVFSNLLFVFLFLPLNLLCYFSAKDIRKKNIVLLVFSLFFYAWGEPKYILLLIIMALADWFFALLIERYRGTKKASAALFGAAAVSIGLIGVFKYGAFFLGNLNSLFGLGITVKELPLPIGISFYTFQLLTYVIDVYRGDAKAQKDYYRVLLYASLFHQCIAGPIVRYKDIDSEIIERHTDVIQMMSGVKRFSVGLAKKALLANVCGNLCDSFLISESAANNPDTLRESLQTVASRPALAIWLGMLFYMLQIYLDFSAYSDMAIGMGEMIGFHYKENFNYPYVSKSVTEFWRRWHISLGTFFRDYVYIPLGGNRKGKIRQLFNMLIVWALTGLWHGASWNYVLWGLYFFVFLAMEKLFLGKVLERLPKAVSHIYLLLIVYFGWILFRYHSLDMVSTVLKGMLGLNSNGFTNFETTSMLKNNIFFLVVAIFAVTPVMKNIGRFISRSARTEKGAEVFESIWNTVFPVASLIISAFSLVGDSYNPFLYFQF